MLPQLLPPKIIKGPNQTLELMWTVCKAYAERLVAVLAQEGRVSAKITEISDKQVMVVASYPQAKENFVIFACVVFRKFYDQCRIAEQMYWTGDFLDSELPHQECDEELAER